MSTLNKLKRVFTREGAPAKAFGPADELKRTLMNCLLWEDQFYEDGVTIADRIKQLVPLVELVVKYQYSPNFAQFVFSDCFPKDAWTIKYDPTCETCRF